MRNLLALRIVASAAILSASAAYGHSVPDGRHHIHANPAGGYRVPPHGIMLAQANADAAGVGDDRFHHPAQENAWHSSLKRDRLRRSTPSEGRTPRSIRRLSSMPLPRADRLQLRPAMRPTTRDSADSAR